MPGCPRPATSPAVSAARPGSPAGARPALRLAAWRAAWAVLRHCDVLAAKHAALTGRDDDTRLSPEQARVACAASLLRWIWSLIVHGTCWDPRIAAGQLGHHHAMAA
jgi:transposase